jgi:RHS repeat-associated protein
LKIEQPRLAGVSSNQEKWITTYYALDASGNTMATYNLSYDNLVGGDPNEFTETFTLNDHTIYGASRLGVVQHNEVLNTRNIEVVSYTGKAFNVVTELTNTPATIDELTFNVRELGKKSYELANHLGNVLAVITDQKIAVDDHQYVSGAGNYNLDTDLNYYHEVAHGTGTYTINSISGDGIVDYYLPNVIMFSDYYPYGMQLINRYGEDNTRKKYRYGFQGQEIDDEVKGEGKSVNYKYRMHDPRIGRFFAVDPLAPKYPHYSPYQFSGNRVLDAIELEGLEEHKLNEKETVYGPYSNKYLDEYKVTNKEGLFSDFNCYQESGHQPPSLEIERAVFESFISEVEFNISGKGMPNTIQILYEGKYGETDVNNIKGRGYGSWLTEDNFWVTGYRYFKDGEEYQASVDGGHLTYGSIFSGHKNLSTGPYYYSKTVSHLHEIEIYPTNFFWNTATNSGTMIAFDYPGMDGRTKLEFTTYVVLTNYLGSGKDRVLGYYQWGVINKGDFMQYTNYGLDFIESTNILEFDMKVILNNIYYSNYKIFGH